MDWSFESNQSFGPKPLNYINYSGDDTFEKKNCAPEVASVKYTLVT